MISTRPRALQSIQNRLLNPLFGLLFGFILIFSYLAWSFRKEYSALNDQIAINSKVSRYVFEISRNRARVLERLLLYRLDRDPNHVQELTKLNSSRVDMAQEIPWNVQSKSTLRSMGISLIGGLAESQYLQEEMVQAVQSQNFARADEAFYQLSTIFEINSARFKDFSLGLEAELIANEQALRALLVGLFWALSGSVLLFAFTIFLIATSYRKSVLRPLRRLHLGLQELTQGDLKLQIPVQSAPRELYEMVVDFNHMVKSLERAQAELTLAREEALQAAKTKANFLSNMSHEIRTPLNAIIGMTDILTEPQTTQDQERYLQILRNSGQVLLNVVNDILDFSKLEEGNFVLEDAAFDMRSVSSRVAEVVEIMARRKALEFVYTFESTGPLWLRGDPKRIEQIILNMLGNAVKFTDAGRVSFHVLLESSPDLVTVSMHFSDTGIGIETDKLASIFNRFSQSDSSITRKFGGSGLGLSIVRQLVEAMKGSVAVASNMGQGSEFVIKIPLASAMEPAGLLATELSPEESVKSLLFEKHVLLVDDTADNRFLIQTYLKKLNCKIATADDGLKAVTLFQEQEFDLVLMDMQMPILDGYEATAQIREIERQKSRPRTPLIALTAFALAEEVSRSYKVGCDLHLTKPIRKGDLFRAISLVHAAVAASPPSKFP